MCFCVIFSGVCIFIVCVPQAVHQSPCLFIHCMCSSGGPSKPLFVYSLYVFLRRSIKAPVCLFIVCVPQAVHQSPCLFIHCMCSSGGPSKPLFAGVDPYALYIAMVGIDWLFLCSLSDISCQITSYLHLLKP